MTEDNPYQIKDDICIDTIVGGRPLDSRTRHLIEAIKELPVAKDKSIFIPAHDKARAAISNVIIIVKYHLKKENAILYKDTTLSKRAILNDKNEYIGTRIFKLHK